MTHDAGLIDLTARVEHAEAVIRRTMDALAAAPGDAHAVFGGVTAFISRGIPNTFFNRAIGLSEQDIEHIPAIAKWFTNHGVPPRFDLAPPRAGPDVRTALREAGCAEETMPGLTRRLLAGSVGAQTSKPTSIRIENAVGPLLESFLDIQMQTWPEDGGIRVERLDRLRRTASAPGLTRLVAVVEGEVAGTAALHVVAGVGWLNSGATVQRYRGRGVQTALIRHRIDLARQLGTDLVCSLVAAGSASERNLRRGGLEPLCDRELWLPPDWTDHPFYRDAG